MDEYSGIRNQDSADSMTQQDGNLQVCCLVFPISFYKNAYNMAASVNFILLVIISVSPHWLVHPEGEYIFTLGFWTKCHEYKCYVIAKSTTSLIITRILIINAIICYLFALIMSRHFLIRCLKINIAEGLLSSTAHFITGISLLSILVLIKKKLRYETEMKVALFLDWDFYLGCVVCTLCFILGIICLFWYRCLKVKPLGIEDKPRENECPCVVSAGPSV